MKRLFKYLMGLVGILMVLFAAGCGNSKQEGSSSASSSTLSQVNNVDHQIASLSTQLAGSNLTPNQTGALVLYYSGVENKQSYVNEMNKRPRNND